MHFNKILTLSTEWFSFKIYLSRDFDYFREKKIQTKEKPKIITSNYKRLCINSVLFFAK